MVENIKKSSPRVVFLGTPEFAVATLKKLVEGGYIIVAVVTAPDKPAGRGMHLQQSPVKKYALEKGLTVLQPEKLKRLEFLDSLRSLHADLQIVVAFRMLPEAVWNMPPMGTINLHASLLPQYRGAAPINWAIINGEKETGLTTFKLQQEIDTGNILLSERMSISENESAGELHDRMKVIGAELMLKTLAGLAEHSLHEQSQSSFSVTEHVSSLKKAPKIFTETCRINWERPVNEVHDLIRGLSPTPGAFTFLKNKMLKIFKAATIRSLQSSILPGNFETDGQTFLRFACTNGYIEVIELQIEGKKKMNVQDFLKGYNFDKK